MEKFQFPRIGARNLKTALSIFLCILICESLGLDSPFYACIAAVICLQDSVENSVKMGKNRMIGTLIGGVAGTFATFILSFYPIYALKVVLVTLLIILVIYTCNVFKKPGAVTIACIVLLATTLLNRDYSNYIYAIARVIETFIGIIVAILVNRFIVPFKKENK